MIQKKFLENETGISRLKGCMRYITRSHTIENFRNWDFPKHLEIGKQRIFSGKRGHMQRVRKQDSLKLYQQQWKVKNNVFKIQKEYDY